MQLDHLFSSLGTFSYPAWNILGTTLNCTHETNSAHYKTVRRWYTHGTSSRDSKLQALIRVHYMYCTLSKASIYVTNVSVPFFAALAQSETQTYVFFCILVPLYQLILDNTKYYAPTNSLQSYATGSAFNVPLCYFSFCIVALITFHQLHRFDPRTYLHPWKVGPVHYTLTLIIYDAKAVFTQTLHTISKI